MRYFILTLLPFFGPGCTPDASGAPADSAGDTDSDTDTDADTDSGFGVTGAVAEGGWSGDGIYLLLSAEWGGWSDTCYGGHLYAPYEATDGAFDWAADFIVSSGGPDQRDMRAIGLVTDDTMDISIVELSGEPYWGPWHLVRDPAVVDIWACD